MKFYTDLLRIINVGSLPASNQTLTKNHETQIHTTRRKRRSLENQMELTVNDRRGTLKTEIHPKCKRTSQIHKKTKHEQTGKQIDHMKGEMDRGIYLQSDLRRTL